jgi:hypothetical protein
VVTAAAIFCAANGCPHRAALLLAEVAKGGDKLPPPTKAAAQMALIGIALVGLLFVAMILLGGHWVRRQGRMRRGPVVPSDRAPIKATPPQRHDEHDEEKG